MKVSADDGYRLRFSRMLLAPRYWASWLGLALFWLISCLPWRVRASLGRWAGGLVYRTSKRRRHIVKINLELCFPQLDEAQREQMARNYFCRLAQISMDYGILWWGSTARLERMVSVNGLEYLRQCQTQGRPVILLTGHSVALDFGATAITRQFATVGLIKPVRNPVIEWLMSRGRTRYQSKLYLRKEGLRPVVRALRRGEAFYYLPDEDLTHVTGSNWIFAPFFGVPTATITALARLARLSSAAVIPCMTYYLPEQGCYRVSFSAPLKDFPSGDIETDTVRMNAELEAMIRRQPEQYMWSLRLFKTRPDNKPSPYT